MWHNVPKFSASHLFVSISRCRYHIKIMQVYRMIEKPTIFLFKNSMQLIITILIHLHNNGCFSSHLCWSCVNTTNKFNLEIIISQCYIFKCHVLSWSGYVCDILFLCFVFSMHSNLDIHVFKLNEFYKFLEDINLSHWLRTIWINMYNLSFSSFLN